MNSTLLQKSDSIRKGNGKEAKAICNLSPFSTLACQVEATNIWRADLNRLADNAKEMFADVSWTSGEGEDTDLLCSFGIGPLADPLSAASQDIIWAHKAILYARAPNTFQARFLQLTAPAVHLDTLASSSTVSLPALRTPSPSLSLQSASTNTSSKRKRVRGAAPPSSFPLSRASSRAHSTLESDGSSNGHGAASSVLKKNGSKVSLVPSNISRPISREERRLAKQSSSDTVSTWSTTPSSSGDSDALSAVSSTSTIKAPISLNGVNRIFFEATLKYLYTAEEDMKETFEFLYEDKIAADEGPEERLEKLRQDLVFMWRSRLYSDIQIVIGDDDDVGDGAALRLIPDATASVISLATITSGVPDEQEENAVFSAHRMMLASRSPYFAAQLLSPYADQDNRIIRLPSPPFTPAALHFTLGFIYTGTLFFSNRTFDLSTAFQIWRAASYLQIESLSSLVSSLIANDFCHEFNCTPPCKTCIKRVPRTLSFASKPDVNDDHLLTLARNTISDSQFGTYWSKEVGILDYTVRNMLVSDVCSKVDARAGYAVHVLRQLSIISTRIDAERSSKWVDAVRGMCESVESHLHGTLEIKLDEVIASPEWESLVQGVGFLNDILEKLLSIVVDGLTEKRAARVYELLVGQVLLREDGPLAPEIVAIVEKSRLDVLQYIRKRWVNIRASAGFDGLKLWALKEIAGEIDVPFNDLLLSTESKKSGPHTRTGLQARSPKSKDVSPHSASSLKSTPGKVVNGEREPGPIHLRAAVLNRNAARSTVLQASPTSTSNSSPGPIRRMASTSSSIMDRPRRSLGPISISQVDTISGRRSDASTSRETRSSVQAPSVQSHLKGISTNPIQSKEMISMASRELPILNLPSDDEDSASLELTPTRSHFDTSIRNGSTSGTSRQASAIKSISRSASGSTLRAANATTSRTTLQGVADHKGKMRQPSVPSSKSPLLSPSAPRRPSVTSIKSADVSVAKTVRKTISSNSINRKKEKRAAPPLTTTSAPFLKDVTQKSMSNAMQLDPNEDMKANLPIPLGLRLSSGIACVVAPRNKAGHAIRFRAIVKYIGPIMGDIEGKPIIGVEVDIPLPTGCDEDLYEFHDGQYQGVRYFDIGADEEHYSDAMELSHKPDRKARQFRLAQMMQGRAESPMTAKQMGVKRRKDLSIAGSDVPLSSSRGLFILPSEVLWVVV